MRAGGNGGVLDSLFGGAVGLLMLSALIAAVLLWPVQCLALVVVVVVGGGAYVGYLRRGERRVRAAVELARAAAEQHEAAAVAAEEAATLDPVRADQHAAAAAMRARGFPESVVASWLAESAESAELAEPDDGGG